SCRRCRSKGINRISWFAVNHRFNKPLLMANKFRSNTGMEHILILFLLCIVAGACTLPSLDNRVVSSTLSESESNETSLGRAISPRAEAHPEKSGVHPLPHPLDAFAARVHLVQDAERTLDVQYYIWNTDMTGIMFMKELLKAAERGVRVRL